MAQIQKGTTYSTGDQVTATNLNALADAAILLPGAITDQTAKTVPLAADTVLIHSAADTALRKSTLTQLFANATGIPLTTGVTGILPAANGGTGVNNGANTITIAGNVTHAGAFTQSFTATANTSLTLPVTGTLATLAGSEALSNKTITASAFNGTVGATTASTGAFTTLSATGAISSSGSQSNNIGAGGTGTGISQFVLNGGSGTNGGSNIAFNKNSVGKAIVGIDSCITGGTSDNLMNYVASGGTIRNYIGGTGDIGIFSYTGLAVTGTLSATGALSITATAASSISRTLSVGALIASGNLNGLGFVPNSTGLSAGYNYSGGDAETNMIFGASSSSQQMRFQRWDGTTLTNVLTLTGAGNVGIGVTPSNTKLEVAGAITLYAASDQTGNSRIYSIIDASTGSSYQGALLFAPQYYNGSTFSNPERMRISSAGNVGIGTSSPYAKLNVENGSILVGQNTNTTQTNTLISGYGYRIGASLIGVASIKSSYNNGSNSASLEFYTDTGSASTERARIDSSGNLLVGTTTAAGNLKGIQANNTSSTQWPLYTTAVDRGLIVSMSATDGIAAYFMTSTSTPVGSINCTSSATTYNSLSDYRRKSNVKDLTGSGTFIDALKPRTFDWDTGDKGVGFIAHEFAEVSPSSVSGEKDAVDADGKPVYQAMQASSAEVIANLVAELQSLRQRVAALENS